jgi:hypothetical protein
MSKLALWLLICLLPGILFAQDKVLFAIDKPSKDCAATLDPIALVRGKQFLKPPLMCEEQDAKEQAFLKEYLAPGMTYSFAFQGSARGQVTVLPVNPESGVGFPVSVSNAPAEVFVGLASDLAPFGLRESQNLSEPDAAMRATALRQAKSIFVSRGVKTLLSNSRILVIRPFVMHNNGETLYAVSADVSRKDLMGPHDDAFFLSTLRPNSKPQLVWYKHSADEVESELMFLISGFDLDRDGKSELITQTSLYENFQYQIFEQLNGAWKSVFKSDVRGCL